MEFRVLGPVELWADGKRHDLGSRKERCVLAVLLLARGRPVSAESLIDAVWDQPQPRQARDTLYSYISRARRRLRRLEGVRITSSRAKGYALETDAENIDLERFRLLRAQARAIADSGDDEQAADLYGQAARLRRGEPLADLYSDWAERTRQTIERELLATTFERINIEMRLGRHAELVGDLHDLLERHPLEEKLVEHLALALYRCGRRAQALNVLHEAMHRLHAEVGTDLGPGLQELQQRILTGDRALLSVREPPGPAPYRHNLPPDVSFFAGRDDELNEVLAVVSPGTASRLESPPTVLALDGMPGVGKTAFAVHLAYLIAEHFPDGQIYLDLHAHDPRQPPIEADAALDLLLRRIGVPPGHVPGSLDGRAALWRGELARRRVLLLLDNAAGHDQIRPLLPRTPGSLAVVTSRRRLAGLDDVWSRSLDLLSPADAARLFRHVVGPGHSMSDTEVATVVRLCDRLPIAVQLTGNRLRNRPAWSVADLIARLSRAGRRLTEIRAENRELTAVFELSYRGLTERQRRAFRRLGLHPGQDFASHTAAAAIGGAAIDAERTLDDLVEHHLVAELGHGRFRFHDLLRDYARELAEQEDPEEDRQTTFVRILDHYLATADHADRRLDPHRRRPYPEPPNPAPIDTAAQARSWLRAEHDNLLSVASVAADQAPEHAGRLVHVIAGYLDGSGHWSVAARLHERAVAIWRERGNRAWTARALCDLSHIRFRLGEYASALLHAREALALYDALGDRHGQADVLAHTGLIHWHQSRLDEALACSRKALEICRSLGDRRGQATNLDHIAIFLDYRGRYQEAARNRHQALDIYADIGDVLGQQKALNNMGDLRLRLGDVDGALKYYKRAAEVAPEMGRQHEAIWLHNMAQIQRRTGDLDAALDGYRKSLAIINEIGDRRSEVEIILGIGATFEQMGRRGEALIHHQKALAMARDISDIYLEVRALRHVGDVLASTTRYVPALKAYEEALRLTEVVEAPLEQAKLLEGIGTVLLHTRGRNEARRHWRQAYRLYDKLGLPEKARIVRSFLDKRGQVS